MWIIFRFKSQYNAEKFGPGILSRVPAFIRVHTNRWDPRLNYPGSVGVVLGQRLYLNEY